MAARKPLGSRVEELARRVDALADDQAQADRHRRRLARIVTQLRHDQKETRERLGVLETVVREGLATVHQTLNDQTKTINDHVDEQSEATKQFVLASLVDIARQWPASAIVIVSAVLGGGVALAADLAAAALHLPHL